MAHIIRMCLCVLGEKGSKCHSDAVGVVSNPVQCGDANGSLMPSGTLQLPIVIWFVKDLT